MSQGEPPQLPLLGAACHAHLPQPRPAAAPLEAVRVLRLRRSVGHLAAFAGTLQHLVLPGLPWTTACQLPRALCALTGLQVRGGGPPFLF